MTEDMSGYTHNEWNQHNLTKNIISFTKDMATWAFAGGFFIKTLLEHEGLSAYAYLTRYSKYIWF